MDRHIETHVIDANFDGNFEHNVAANLEHTADVNLEHNVDVSIEHTADASLEVNIDTGIEAGGEVDIDGGGGGVDLGVEADVEGALGLEATEDAVAGAEAEVLAGFQGILDEVHTQGILDEVHTQGKTAMGLTHDSDGAGSDGEVPLSDLNLAEEVISTGERVELVGEGPEDQDAPWPYEGEVSGGGVGEEAVGIGGDLSFGAALTGDFQAGVEVKAEVDEEEGEEEEEAPFEGQEGEIEEVEVNLEVDTEVMFGAVYDNIGDIPVRAVHIRADSPESEITAPAFTLDTEITAHAATNGHPSPPPRPVAPSFCLSSEDSDGELAELDLSDPELYSTPNKGGVSFEKEEEPIPRVGACENKPKKKRLSKRVSKACLAMEPPKLEQIKKWTITNYRYTKQLVSEKLGHANKTLDQELEDRIGELKVGRVQYQSLLKEARTLQARYDALLSSHRNLRSQFQTLIAHAPELQDQLQACATTQNILEKNGEGLLGAIRTFVDSLNTLVNVTVQDTLLTVKNYENARIEYDAYRNEIDSLQKAPQNEQVKNKLLELQVIFEIRKSKWERLKNDTHTKLNLLNENKSNVMKQQLEMFNSAVVAYFSGNGDKLSEVLSEYHIKTKNASEDDVTSKSFLTRSE